MDNLVKLVKSKTMRELIIIDLENMKRVSGGFQLSRQRWEGMFFDGTHINRLVFRDMEDEDLLCVFKAVYRRFHAQM
jgi:hypothetical protein